MNDIFDIRWRIHSGGWIPIHHRYFLLAAVSAIVPDLHRELRFGIHPVHGIRIGPGKLQLTNHSAVTVRSPIELLPILMPLSGQKLDLGGHHIRLGVPEVLVIRPSRTIYSPVVTIKGYMEPKPFSGALVRQLDIFGVRPSVSVTVGERRVIRVRDRTIVGFQIRLGELSPDESHRILSQGLGGRRHLGCGLFLPDRLARIPQRGEAL